MSSPDPGSGPTRTRRVLRSLKRLWEPPICADVDSLIGRGATRGLHVCPRCGSDCVNPAWTLPVDDETWAITLRCGACADRRDAVISNAEAARFDRDLDRGWDAIARSLAALERERMTDWTEAFIGALRHGLVDADDFVAS
jgi:hypothetical protein